MIPTAGEAPLAGGRRAEGTHDEVYDRFNDPSLKLDWFDRHL